MQPGSGGKCPRLLIVAVLAALLVIAGCAVDDTADTGTVPMDVFDVSGDGSMPDTPMPDAGRDTQTPPSDGLVVDLPDTVDQNCATPAAMPTFEMLLRSRSTVYSGPISIDLFAGRLTASSLPGCLVTLDDATLESLRTMAAEVDWDQVDNTTVCTEPFHRVFDATVRYTARKQFLPGVKTLGTGSVITYPYVRDFTYCEGRGGELPEALFTLLERISDLAVSQCEGFPTLVRQPDTFLQSDRERFQLTVEQENGNPPVEVNRLTVESGFLNLTPLGLKPIELSDYDFGQIREMSHDLGTVNELSSLDWCPPHVPRVNACYNERTSSGADDGLGCFNYCMVDVQSRVPENVNYLARRLESLIFRASYRRMAFTPVFGPNLTVDEGGAVVSTSDVDVALYYEEPLSGVIHSTGYFGGAYWYDSECRSNQIQPASVATLRTRVAELLEYAAAHEAVACNSDTPQYVIWARVGADSVDRRFCLICATVACDDSSVVLPLVDALKEVRQGACVF